MVKQGKVGTALKYVESFSPVSRAKKTEKMKNLVCVSKFGVCLNFVLVHQISSLLMRIRGPSGADPYSVSVTAYRSGVARARTSSASR